MAGDLEGRRPAVQQGVGDVGIGTHPAVRTLFDKGWMHLLVLEDGRIAARYQAGADWQGVSTLHAAA